MLQVQEEDDDGPYIPQQRYADNPSPPKKPGVRRGISDVEMVDASQLRNKGGKDSVAPRLRPLSMGPAITLGNEGPISSQNHAPTGQTQIGDINDRSNSVGSSIYPESVTAAAPTQTHWSQAETTSSVSTGQVHHHIAGDNIHEYTLSPAHIGSAAELVDPFGGSHEQTAPRR
jgi:hypothetical protein